MEKECSNIKSALINSNEFVHSTPKDFGENSIICLSCHKGNTPETIAAAKLGKEKGAAVIILTWLEESEIVEFGDYIIQYSFDASPDHLKGDIDYAGEKTMCALLVAVETLQQTAGYENYDKFYEGLFELHYDKIKEEFDKMWLAYPNKSLYAASKYNRFTDIIVGVAPKGYVIVWLSSLSQQIQIGRFQAKETKAITWERFAGMNGIAPEQTRERYVRMYREMEKMPSSIPFGKLEQYQKKYTWKPKIVYETSVSGEKILPLKYRIQYYSGDLEYIYELYEKKNLPLSRFVPKEIIFEFNIGSKAFGGGFDIDEEDIYKAFNLLAKDNETDLELVVKLDKDEEISKIVLRNKTNEYVLKCTDVQIGAGEIDPKINPLEETE